MEGTAAREQTTTSACSSCGAAMRRGAPWCTLCLTPTVAPPAAAPTREAPTREAPTREAPTREADRPVLVPLTAPLDQVLGGPAPAPAGWPCTACGQHNALDRAACDACGSGFLAELAAADAPLLVLPLVGDLRRYGRGQLLVLAGAVIGGVVLLVVLLAMLGLLLG